MTLARQRCLLHEFQPEANCCACACAYNMCIHVRMLSSLRGPSHCCPRIQSELLCPGNALHQHLLRYVVTWRIIVRVAGFGFEVSRSEIHYIWPVSGRLLGTLIGARQCTAGLSRILANLTKQTRPCLANVARHLSTSESCSGHSFQQAQDFLTKGCPRFDGA